MGEHELALIHMVLARISSVVSESRRIRCRHPNLSFTLATLEMAGSPSQQYIALCGARAL